MAFDFSKIADLAKDVKNKLDEAGIDSLDDIKELLEGDGLKDIIAKFANEIKSEAPDSDAGKSVVKKISDFVSDKVDSCSPELLRKIGGKLTSGKLKEKVEDAAGDGAAKWISTAIDKWADKV